MVGRYWVLPWAGSDEDSGFEVNVSLVVGVDHVDELTEDDFTANLSAAGQSARCPVSGVRYSEMHGMPYQPFKDTGIVATASFHCGIAVTGPADMTFAVKGTSRTLPINLPPPS